MSGGTDSSAVCLMLREAGYEVVGMTMRVWDIPAQFDEGDDLPRFIRCAQQLAARLNIEHHVLDVRREFADDVVQYFLDEYAAGRTPNPCVRCNRRFKFRLLEELADRLGCDLMATGHYVRTEWRNGHLRLLMGDDMRKDQSYFLWRVPERVLRRCLFPLGGMEKADVRAYLSARGFEADAVRRESMEVCFVEGDYRDFFRTQRPEAAERLCGGSFVDSKGRRLGQHLGVPFYTVGQRKGLGIALGKPAYVVRLNAEKNTVVIGDEEELSTSAFFVEGAEAPDINALFAPQGIAVRIRYHSMPVPCTVEPLPDGRLLVRTEHAVNAVTPGQSAVFYEGRSVAGGAVIAAQRGIGMYLDNSKTECPGNAGA